MILIYNEGTGFLREAEITKYDKLRAGVSLECVFTDEYGSRVKQIFYALSTDSFTVQLDDYYIIDIRSLIDLNTVVGSRFVMKIISKMTISDLKYYLPKKYLV